MSQASDKIVLRNVSFRYNGAAALEDVSFEADETDFVGIIGPNGGGKTTLLKLLMGLSKPSEGDISVFGKPPSAVTGWFGYVPQNTSVNVNFPITVRDVTLLGRIGNGRKIRFSARDREIARAALEKVDMWDLRDRKIAGLSGGQRQRVFIARALTAEPRILLLDEPAASLDPSGQKKLFDILKELNEHLTIFLVSHDLNNILGYVNKVACVNRRLYFHEAPHVTAEMLSQSFGFSFDQMCPLEELPQREESAGGDVNGEGK